MDLGELKAWIDYSHSPYYPSSDDPNVEFLHWFEEDYVPEPSLEYELQLALFEGYLHTMEGYLEQGAQKAKDEAEEIRTKITEKLDELEKDIKAGRISSDSETVSIYEQQIITSWEDPSAYEHYSLETIDEFADTLRKSFFVNLYGFWESQLFPLCKSLKSYDETMPSPGNVRDYPKRAEKFFDRIDFPIGDGTIWNIILNYYRPLRNCIAHNNGELDRSTERDKVEKFILSEQPLLSIEGQDDIFLNERDGVFVQEGRPQFYSKKTLIKTFSDSGEIDFKEGDVFIDQTGRIVILPEDFTFQRDKEPDIKVQILEEGEKIIFRKGKIVVSQMNNPINFQEDDAVIFREGKKVIFRQKVICQEGSKVVVNKGFCEKVLETITKYFDELLDTLANWDLSQKTS